MPKFTLESKIPESLGVFPSPTKEYMQYLYYPCLFPSTHLILEPRLQSFSPMVNAALAQFRSKRMWDNVYVYLTVKQTFVPKDIHQNRPGWHADGFGTNDVQYIWFDKFPTEFMIGSFDVDADDIVSMLDMEAHAKKIEWAMSGDIKGDFGGFFYPEPFQLYEIDANHIHRTTPATESGSRMFVKITISEHQYAQEGNSVNYHTNYQWDFAPRKAVRNQPHIK